MKKLLITLAFAAISSSAFAGWFDSDAKYICNGTQNVIFQKTWILEYKDKAFSIDNQLLKCGLFSF